MTQTRDENVHETMDDRWEFNAEVTRVFDDMLERSIPQYHAMRRTVFEIGRRFAPGPESEPLVVDLGCSRGEALAPFADAGWSGTGFEISVPMLNAARERFMGDPQVTIFQQDLRETVYFPRGPADVVLAVLTLLFVPINHRQRIVRDAYDQMRDGGAMIVVEKVLGRGATVDQLMVELYHETKVAAGYSREEVDRKALALEGVQVPVTAAWNEDLLRNAGFREVDCFWRWCNFAGWVAVK